MTHSFIVIEGNIGAGKTSLAKRLSDDSGARLILEQFEDNSFLPKFYANPEQYAFPLEMSFLADRYQQLKKELVSRELFSDGIISDYVINKSLIFARKTLGEDEYALYKRLFEIIHSALPRPDLLVYLHTSVSRLLQNIEKRGRQYEEKITPEYLEKIQASYFDFFKSRPDLPILIIDTEDLDFVSDQQDFDYVKNLISRTYQPGIIFSHSVD